MAKKKVENEPWGDRVSEIVFAVPLLLFVVLPVAFVGAICFACYALFMILSVWVVSCLRGRYVLFVYSNSPVWQEYVEQNILPRLPREAVILNWSERSKWKRFSFRIRVFYLFGGGYQSNPMGLVFRPFPLVRTFRFWRAFRDFKHGKTGSVTKVENELFQYLGVPRTDNRRTTGSTGRS